MGFFDKILQGLGFEGEDDSCTAPRIGEKEKKELISDFDSKLDLKTKKKRKLIKFAPKSQSEVEKILEDLKYNNDVIINLEYFNDSDVLRAMDFIAGYCKCLGASIKKIDEYTFSLELICD